MCFRPPEAMAGEQTCSECGAKVPAGVQNCPECGTNVFGIGTVDASAIPAVKGPAMKFPGAPSAPGFPKPPTA